MLFPFIALVGLSAAASPQLVVHNDGSNGSDISTTISNDIISMHIGSQYGTKLIYHGDDLVGNASGAYASYSGETHVLNYTSVSIAQQTDDVLDVAYTAQEGTLHFVLFEGLSGFYSYFVNAALGEQGAFRTLYRLAPEFFPNGRTYIKDAPLPLWSDILASTKVQDETWQLPNGSYITKYDNSRFVFSDDFHGVYGPRRGAWVISPGRDYLNGDSLKQELSVHRESRTGDAVLLNILHGTHFQTSFENTIPEGKVFGPWLVYINNGSVADAARKAKEEDGKWPYTWFNGPGFHSRGTLRGTLVLDDGKPAAGAAVFLGDDGKTISQGTTWVYNVNASSDGTFEIRNVRTEKQYTLQAWANGGNIGAVTTVFKRSNITLSAGTITDLGKLVWKTQRRKALWRLGDFDRKALGFKYGGTPYTHGLVDNCPANFTYTIGVSKEKEWCFGKSAAGTWRVVFDGPKGVQENDTVLTVSLAGCSGSCSRIGGEGATLEVWVNGENLGDHPTPLGGNDPSLYRSATEAGEWRYFEWNLTKGVIVEGRNTVEFVTPASVVKRWKGVMWDAIMLEVA